MRKINLFAVPAALILAGVGGWVASTPQASVAAPIVVRIDPLQMMMNAKDLSIERYEDLSLHNPALGQFHQDYGPQYREAVQNGESEDAALSAALSQAGISATGFGLPGSFLKQLLVQPAIGAAAERGASNLASGRARAGG
jgi:hypothetical protein